MPQSQTLKVLHITRSEELGIRAFLAGLIANTDRSRFAVKVAGPLQGPLVGDLDQLGVPSVYCPVERDIKPWTDVRTIIHMWRIIRREAPDILHLHGAKAGFLGRIAGRLNRVPAIVYTPNNDYLDEPTFTLRNWFLVVLEKCASLLGAQIVSVTREERENWIRRGICNPRHIITIHDGFDFSRATRLVPRNEAKRSLGIPADSMVAGLVARMVPQKAPHVFLQAAAQVLRQINNVFFLMVGDGPLRHEMEELARELGIADQVRFLGYVDNLSEVYSAMDVSVLTSLYEGLPMVVLESMYLQIPVVVSNTYGVTEVVTENCGIVVPVLNPQATAAGILTILSDREGSVKMARQARSRVVAEFGAEQMAARYQELYLGLLQTVQLERVGTRLPGTITPSNEPADSLPNLGKTACPEILDRRSHSTPRVIS